MVMTRAQAKRDAKSSPEATSPNPLEKHPRKKAVQPLSEKLCHNILEPDQMEQRGSKKQPAEAANSFPVSHPINISVPPSPAGQPDQNLDVVPHPMGAPSCTPCGEKLLPKPSERPIVPSERLPDGPEPAQIDVEYLARDQLQPLDNPAADLEACLLGLEAADWAEAVKALNLLRQLAVHHPDCCKPQLETLLKGVLKSVRNLRSSLCKTAIMAVADLYISFGDVLLPFTDVGGQPKPMTSMLAQILLKSSSNDKKFVIEEAQRALRTMAESLSPEKVIVLLEPYVNVHKNPKVRGKAGVALAVAVARMQPMEMESFGMPKVLQLAGKLITDNTPEAREAAKQIVGFLSAAFADLDVRQQLDLQVPDPELAGEGEEMPSKATPWEYYCRCNLNASAAIAVLKVTD